MTASYFIREFDSTAGVITVEFIHQKVTTTIVLPLDANGVATVGQELDKFILNFTPQQPPTRPVANATDIQNMVVPAPPPVLTWDDLKPRRDRELAASDWTVLPDVNLSPELKNQWMVYRQQLRDLPQTYPDASTVVWPQPPV